MKSAEITAYGPPSVIRFTEGPIPTPKPGEVLVRVAAAPVTAGDVRLRSGKVPRGMGLLLRAAIGLRRPRVRPGWGFAGTIEALGEGAQGFNPGQRVMGIMGFKGGAHAEYLTIRADGALLPLPDTLSLEEGAAFFFGGLTALHFLADKAHLQPGERALILGATGAVGSAALQIARHLGARVTAVCSPANHALAQSLGAEAVHDYRTSPAPEGRFDVILDVMGTLPWPQARAHLAKGGRLCMITASLAATLGATLRPRRGDLRLIAGTSSEAKDLMQRLLALHEQGGYRPVIGQALPFDQLAKAHEVAESFHKPGNLVVEM